MKPQVYAFVLGVVGPAAIALALLACKEEAPKTNEEVLTEILAEIDRGEVGSNGSEGRDSSIRRRGSQGC